MGGTLFEPLKNKLFEKKFPKKTFQKKLVFFKTKKKLKKQSSCLWGKKIFPPKKSFFCKKLSVR